MPRRFGDASPDEMVLGARAAVERMGQLSEDERNRIRLQIMSDLEQRANSLDESSWRHGADAATLRVAGDVRGALATALLLESGYKDPNCFDVFRGSAPMVGQLASSGERQQLAEREDAKDSAELRNSFRERNCELLRTLKVDANADELAKQLREEEKLGRVTPLVPLN